jgi:hypothetical protein
VLRYGYNQELNKLNLVSQVKLVIYMYIVYIKVKLSLTGGSIMTSKQDDFTLVKVRRVTHKMLKYEALCHGLTMQDFIHGAVVMIAEARLQKGFKMAKPNLNKVPLDIDQVAIQNYDPLAEDIK